MFTDRRYGMVVSKPALFHRRVCVVFFLCVIVIVLLAMGRYMARQLTPIIALFDAGGVDDESYRQSLAIEGLPDGLLLPDDLQLIRFSRDQGIYEFATESGGLDLYTSLESKLIQSGWQTLIPDEYNADAGYGYLLAFPQEDRSGDTYLFFQWEERAEGTLILLQQAL